MANKNGWHTVALSPQVMDEYVVPVQERIFAATGVRVSSGAIVRRLVELGAAVDMRENISHMVSSGAQ